MTAARLQPAARPVLLGILLAAVAIGLFSIQDAFVKAMTAHYSVVMVLFLRTSGTLPLAVGLVWREGGAAAFRTRRLALQLLRGVILFVMFVGFYVGLSHLSLATATTLVFSAPLITTLLSAIILKEPIGVHRIGAVLVGFLGVLIVVRPGGDAFHWAALLCILASFCYSLSMVLTRYLGDTESLGRLVFYPNLVFILGAGLMLPWVWVPPDPEHLALIVGFGGVTFLAHMAITQAYRIAPPPVLAPFDYTSLVWALLWGWLIWDEWPSDTTLLGAAVVIAAGLYVVYREARLGREERPPPLR